MSQLVLVVDDEAKLVSVVKGYLEQAGYRVATAANGREALFAARDHQPDLIILDMMMPVMDGLAFMREYAREGSAPIIALTARVDETDKVLGLEMGADDYLTKPFSVREFIARVKAIFRRMDMLQPHANTRPSAAELHFGSLAVDLDKRRVTIDDKRVELSPKEFDLLSLLASNPGKSYDRSKILDLVWGYEFEGYEHTVNSHINRLRSKIEPDIANPTYILTTWGVGYRFNEEL
ncbi:MAG: response regulator transcription factor [Anaerolineales bacterium]|nr:response regulator transcription factor [Anaerolineales bacterium]